MKISELIAELEKARAEHGDLPVYYHDCEYGLEEPEQVRLDISIWNRHLDDGDARIVIE